MSKDETTGEKRELPEGSLTIIDTIYHRVQGENPSEIRNTHFQELTSEEQQPYKRQCRVSESGALLDLGWFVDKPSQISYLHLSNDEGKFLTVNPTDEERSAVAAKVLFLSFRKDGRDTPFCQIVPGDSLRLNPTDIASLHLSSASGTTRFTITVYPK